MKTVTSLVVALAISLALPTAPASAQVFSNEEQSCALYGPWAVEEMRKAERLGCNFPDRQLHFDVSRHVRWCMWQSDATMRAAVTTHRNNIAAICGRQGINLRGSPQPAPAAAAGLPSFSNEEQSCVLYGDWAVQEIRRAQGLGCNSQQANEILDPRVHMNWCMRQTADMMRKTPLIHSTGVVHRCALQGVDVRRR